MSRRRPLIALARSVVMLLLGAVIGLATVGVHHWWPMLVLAAAACAAVMVALPSAWWSRPPFVVGFAVIVGLAMSPRSEGDYLIASDAQGYTLLGMTLVLIIGAFVTLPRPRGPRPQPRKS